MTTSSIWAATRCCSFRLTVRLRATVRSDLPVVALLHIRQYAHAGTLPQRSRTPSLAASAATDRARKQAAKVCPDREA